MIYASMKDTDRYLGIHPGLDIVLNNLNPEFLAGVGDETIELDGKNVYCFKVSFDTLPEEKTFFEIGRAHV